METNLQHHGIKGQKWGVRRYQNKDGSLTPAGKKREYGKSEDSIGYKYNKPGESGWNGAGRAARSAFLNSKVGSKYKLHDDPKKELAEVEGKAPQKKGLSERQKMKAANKSIKNDRAQASKNRRTLSDADIDARINRLKKEKQLKGLTDAELRPGRTAVKNFMKGSGGKVLTAAATGAMAYAGYDFMEKKGWTKAASYMFPNPHKKK